MPAKNLGVRGAQLPGAGADEQCVHLAGNETGLLQRRGQGAGGEPRRFPPKTLIEFVRRQRENAVDVRHREMPGGNAAVMS